MKPIYKLKLTRLGNTLYKFFVKKWFFDLIYFFFIVKPILSCGYNITFKLIDRGLIEIFGPLGLTRFINDIANLSIKNQTGYIFNYAFMMLLGFMISILVLQGFFDIRAKIILLFILLLINDLILTKKNEQSSR